MAGMPSGLRDRGSIDRTRERFRLGMILMVLAAPAPALAVDPPSGSVPDGWVRPGAPLLLTHAPANQVTLTWGSSCQSGDTDYIIYEGSLGAWTSHVPVTCSTGGAISATLTPATSSSYYLIVPRNATFEGSHGLRSDRSERPSGASLCLPRDSATCNGLPCAAAAECASGSCVDGVCCNTSCGGTCRSCLGSQTGGTDGTCGSITPGTDPAGECTPYRCTVSGSCGTTCASGSDCAPGFFCQAGSCVPRLPNGAACTAGSSCESGFCVDGVCCNASCGGTCRSCLGSQTGGTDGTCGSITPGTDPAGECTPYRCVASGLCGTTCATGSDCAPGYFCQGGACVPKLSNGAACTASSSCQSGLCVDGVCCNVPCAGTCRSCLGSQTGGSNGTCGSITPGTDPAGECTPYRCAVGGCGTTCTTGSDCAPGYFCQGGACVLKLSNGSACTAGSSCQSGFCTDGVCCNASCGGTCRSCLGSQTGGANGTCGFITAGTDPAGECGAGATCNGSGGCLGGPGASCTLSSQCTTSACCSGICRDTQTDASHCGACGSACVNPHGTTSCVSGACAPVCDPSWGDCNANPADGCETSLTTLSHCGACGNVCTIPNAVESCATGTCQFVQCDTGFSNCDASTANGCEVGHGAPANTCATSVYMGAQCGDENCGTFCPAAGQQTFATITGRSTRWFRATVSECSGCTSTIGHRVSLSVPAGVDYDLYVWSACGGTLLGSSTSGPGVAEQVIFQRTDTLADDSFNYYVEVRWFGGASCSQWSLTFTGTNC